MSDQDQTPETPITVGDRMGWFRGDIGVRLTTLTTKLDTVILGLDTLNTTLNTALGVVQQRMLGPDGAHLGTMTENIARALGAQPYNDLELASIRSWIYTIMQNLQRIGVDPDTNTGTGTQIGSTGTISLDGYRYIIWPEITGVVRNTDGTQLTPYPDWSGYSVYIQSDAPTATLFDLTNSQLTNNSLATNTWITLGDSHILSFAVPSMYNAKGFMRVPNRTGHYYWGAADIEVVNVPNYGNRYMWNMTKYPALQYVQNGVNPRAIFGSWSGYKWTMTGTALNIQYGANWLTEHSSSNATGTFPANTYYILCQSTASGITIKLEPPA